MPSIFHGSYLNYVNMVVMMFETLPKHVKFRNVKSVLLSKRLIEDNVVVVKMKLLQFVL